jgi:putative PEP-CTERM system TPR-repeat lipoprotein
MRSGPSRASLLLGLALAACAAWAADSVLESPTQASGRAADWYEQALTEVNAGQTSAAYLNLKRALRQDPFFLAGHLLLARVYIQLGQGDQAEKELLIADGLGAHQSLTLIPLARSYLLQGEAAKLLGELFPLGTQVDEDAELLALRGQAHVQLGQLYDAQRAFEQAGERDPTNVSAMLGRAHVLMLQGDLNEASGDVRRAVALAPDNPRAWLLRGMLLRGQSDVPAALRDFERAVAVLPAYLPAQIARISALLELDRFDQALAAAEESLTLCPRDPRSFYLKAVVHARRQDFDAAQAALHQTEALISQVPRELIDAHPPTLLLAGMVNYSLKQWTQAAGYLAPFLDQFPDTVGPRILLARIALDRQQNERAIRLLEPALSLAPGDQQVLSLLGEAFMREGQHVKAALFLQQALEAGDDNLVLRTQRAVNQFGLGRKAQAIEELGAVVAADPQYAEAGATLVVASLKERRFAEAVKVAAQLLEGQPANITYLNLYGVAQLAAGNRAAARWAFDLALALDWRFVPAQLNLAELDLRENRPNAARDRLQLVLARNPDQLSALLLLARTVEQLGLHEQARQLAERAVRADPTAVPAAVYLTDLLLKMQQTEAALTVVEAAEVRAANREDLDLLVTLSRAYLATGHRATAQVVLQRGSSLAGYDAAGLLELALLQRQAGDRNGAIWSLEKAVEGQPRYLPTRIKLGELYAEGGKLTQAETLAAALRKDFPQEPYGEHLLGTIARARGDDARALEHFKRALKLRESPVLAVRAYETLRVVQGVGPATDFLRRWIEKHPDDAVARQALAEGLFRAGRVAEAKAIYQRALLRTPENPILLNNLALIYAQEGDAQGIALARKAQALLPVPEIADTLGWVLVRAGQVAEGLGYLRDAQSRAAADPGISYHIAYALVRMGRDEEALRELALLVRKDADFPEQEAADQLRREVQARLGRGSGARDAGLDLVVE